MMVRVYPEGAAELARDYLMPPADAVLRYCEEEHRGASLHVDLIVEPLDTVARDAAGWHDDGEGPVFRMFKMRGRVEWTAEEVDTLNPYYTGPDTRAERVSR